MRSDLRMLAVLSLLMCLGFPAHAEPIAFEDLGPLRIRDQFALSMGFLAFDPESADVLAPGRWQIDLIVTGTNTFAKSRTIEAEIETGGGREPVTREFLEGVVENSGQAAFYLDGEFYRSVLAIRRGIGRRTQVGVAIQLLDFGGGWMDSSIEEFHDLFGLGQAGRLGVTRGEVGAFVSDGVTTTLYSERNPGVGLGDLTVNVKRGLEWTGSKWNISSELVVKAPTGRESDLYSSGSWDAGVQLLVSRYWEKSCIHASAGVAYLGDSETLGTDSQVIPSVMVGYEHGIFNTRNSAVIQATISESPFASMDLPELGTTSIQASLGLKCSLNPSNVIFIALTENIAHFDNTADIGLHLAWTGRF